MNQRRILRKLIKDRKIYLKEAGVWKCFEIESFEFRGSDQKLAIITKKRNRIVYLEDVIGFWKERYKV